MSSLLKVSEKNMETAKRPAEEDSDDEDEPLAKRTAKDKGNGNTHADKSAPAGHTNGAAKNVAKSNGLKRKAAAEDEDDEQDDEDSDDDDDDENDGDYDAPFSERKKGKTPPKRSATKPASKTKPPAKKPANGSAKKPAGKKATPPAKNNKKQKTTAKSSTPAKRSGSQKNNEEEIKWTTLEHAGVLFPPEYETHGVKMLYDGKPVDLTKDQEEVATMYAAMLETDYMKKDVFLKNFWEGFKEVLGKNHVIKSLDKCEFRPIYDYLQAEREKKKNLPKEEKDRLKKKSDEETAKYKFAKVDGRLEPVGNFRVEPPGLFRGRGEHPKMGKIKKRIYPRDITINIGKDAPKPEHPYKGQQWKEVRHDQCVTWLAYWKDTISNKDFKYVWLGATSTFKADSDLAKYEKARKLKDCIGTIRENYTRDWDSPNMQRRQMACALYFIDKLALRAGHEKDDDEADTVGCCTLKIENVNLMPNHQVKFDFLGKDSIRYENVVEVDKKVYSNLERFMNVNDKGKKKGPNDQLFDAFDATDLNKELKQLMDGLSVKVFRTYNASITLDRLLFEMEQMDNLSLSVDEKKAEYDRANKEVAILCNHQRSVPKTHENQMSKIEEKMAAMRDELEELKEELALAKAGKAGKDGKKGNPEAIRNRISKKEQQIERENLKAKVKEDLKTVALGTSKINYMDPRITIAWCKRNEVPIEKVFNKSLLGKFNWAMDVVPEFRF